MRDQATQLRKIAQQFKNAARLRQPVLLVVTSGKGGVGKSTISLNLAIALSDAGQRVLLVDADANLGSIDVMLGLAPRFRLGHVLRGEMELQDILISPQPGLKILPASSGETDYPGMDEEAQGRLVEEIGELADRPDYVIVDTPAGIGRDVLGYAHRADEVYVVSNPEPTAIMDAYAMMKVIWNDRPEAGVHFILNSARAERETAEVIDKLRVAVRHFLHRELDLLGIIPADAAAQRAVTQQQPVLKLYPRSEVAQAVRGLAQEIQRQTQSVMERRASAQ